MAAHQIPAEHYDGRMHAVPFAVGADFVAKWDGYRADGFTVASVPGRQTLLVCKVLPGDPLPPLPKGF